VKKGSLALAVMVVISGFLRLTGPAATSSALRTAETSSKKNELPTHALSWYQQQFDSMVQEFCVESSRCLQARFVVAVLPDPVHTHLALLFDRSIEALQQAAQSQEYAFDRSILPWDRTPHQDADLEKRQKEQQEQALREANPGLLIFRSAKGESPPLFVLVVAETPTGGLRGEQFQNALDRIAAIRGKDAASKTPLLILGPTFSGSLDSLQRQLQLAANRNAFAETVIYSGTVTHAESVKRFGTWLSSTHLPAFSGDFTSFQQNDRYLLQHFVNFACAQNYEEDEIAVLSEDETASGKKSGPQTLSVPNCIPSRLEKRFGAEDAHGVVLLHFPREISFFRSAYQKAAAAQPSSEAKAPGRSTLTLDLGDTGTDDDSVAPYGGLQTPLSQEAVMLGLVSELQKHHIVFTVLFATDPVDQLFLARYLQTAYPQGRVVITIPDLLFAREEDTLLRGVLSLNSYPLVPGLDDKLCRSSTPESHEDRLFVSSASVGVYNAMVGLLSPRPDKNAPTKDSQMLPPAPYADYSALPVVDRPFLFGSRSCPQNQSALLWLTILGQDGFWPVSALDADPAPEDASALRTVSGLTTLPLEEKPSTPGAWNIACCLCLLLMLVHALFSWTGSILADSESSAQFARVKDRRDTFILAIGALCLAVAFVILICARSPLVKWSGLAFLPPALVTTLLWLAFFLFAAVTFWDLAKLRGQPPVAISFTVVLGVITLFLLLLAFDVVPWSHLYWPPRVIHLTSGVSPVLPVLLLFGAGYWWMWQSLRGVTLVDLRRPRLPAKDDLHLDALRIDDVEGEKLRHTAHPFFFEWQVLIPVVGLSAISATVVDLDHPVQTVEGLAYDLAYSLLLLVMIASFLGCLLKLVRTWFDCRHILGGLDRLPLREAFSRMIDLSWHSMWNPGGSTLRETYKLMSRALENLGRLDLVLQQDQSLCLTAADRTAARTAIASTLAARDTVHTDYVALVQGGIGLPWRQKKQLEAQNMPGLLANIEALQKHMAKTAAVLVAGILRLFWADERGPVISKVPATRDAKGQKDALPLTRILAEEYVGLVYVNFLVTVLLRMRTMVISAGGMFVFIVLSINSYPFEPHPALQTLAVLMLLVMGGAVGYVYAQMHREPILSRLTSSESGELGWDFWLKFAAAAAIPVFSLLAAQFPSINQILFSWLEPALQAVK
jgi:hypothetical protein